MGLRHHGIDFSAEGPDIDVVGFALDGRPEPKFARGRTGGSHALVETTEKTENYDDYENHAANAEQSSITSTFMTGATTTARIVGKLGKVAARQTRTGWAKLREQLRHLDRN